MGDQCFFGHHVSLINKLLIVFLPAAFRECSMEIILIFYLSVPGSSIEKYLYMKYDEMCLY